MKQRTLIGLMVFAGVLASCAAQPRIDGEIPPTAPPQAPTSIAAATPMSTAPAPSSAAAVYKDDANGFELDYPSDWSVSPNTVIGSRGSQAQLLSPGATAEQLPVGASRVGITVYLWDPKNDLAAYVDHRKLAWQSGTQTIESQEDGALAGGRQEVDFIVSGADGARAFFLLTTLGDRYLEIAGEGNLELTREIARTLRPVGYGP
jgi:hypothetical protein